MTGNPLPRCRCATAGKAGDTARPRTIFQPNLQGRSLDMSPELNHDFRSLEGRVALVTGAARGIGREIALRLAVLGDDVAVNDVPSAQAGAEQTAAKIRELGRISVVTLGSVASGDDAARMISEVEEALGGLDILVNNAGLTRDGLFVRMTEEDWDLVVDVSLKGSFLMSKAAARGMMKRRRGAIAVSYTHLTL